MDVQALKARVQVCACVRARACSACLVDRSQPPVSREPKTAPALHLGCTRFGESIEFLALLHHPTPSYTIQHHPTPSNRFVWKFQKTLIHSDSPCSQSRWSRMPRWKLNRKAEATAPAPRRPGKVRRTDSHDVYRCLTERNCLWNRSLQISSDFWDFASIRA